MYKNCYFEMKVDFKVNLKPRLKFKSCLEIMVVSKICQNPSFISAVSVANNQHFKLFLSG